MNLRKIKQSRFRRVGRLSGSLTLVAALAGCASFSADGGLSTARTIASTQLNKDVVKVSTEAEAASVQRRAELLLRSPLTPDAAVQVALLRNRGLQAAFSDLGISEARYVQATIPAGPRVSLLRVAGSMSLEIERSIIVGLFELATLPARAGVAEQRFRAAQYRTAEAVLRLAAETRRDYYRTVAANQQMGFLQQALGAAESASELAKRLGESGSLNKLEQAREHAFYVETGAQLARARIQQKVERERLTRQLGLWGRDIDFRLPSSLPALPSRLATGQEIERRALEQRVDLQVARLDLRALAAQYGLTNATRFINDFELAGVSTFEREKSVTVADNGEREVEVDKVKRRGVEVEFQIPIFDFGRATVRNAQETYMASANRLAERAVNIRSEAREAYLGYRGNYDLARYYQNRVLPQRQTIQDEALLQYSGMLIDVDQLITDARGRIVANVEAINARRDFWIADVNLQAALIGGGVGGGEEGEAGEAAGGAAGGEEDED